MRPMIVVPPGTISKDDIARLDENGVLVVEAKDPAALRCIDPLPVQSSRTQIEHAAIQLSRRLLSGQGFGGNGYTTHASITALYVELLAKGTPLQPGPTQEEIEQRIMTNEREAELRRIAREEARAEREAKKKTAGKKAAE